MDRYLLISERYTAFVAKIGLFLLMLIIAVNVIGRRVLGTPVPDAILFAELYFMPMAIFLYLSTLERNEGNVNVDILKRNLADHTNHIINLFVYATILIIFVPVLRRATGNAIEAWHAGATVGVTQLPTYPSWVILITGILLLSLRLMVKSIDIVIELASVVREFRQNQGP